MDHIRARITAEGLGDTATENDVQRYVDEAVLHCQSFGFENATQTPVEGGIDIRFYSKEEIPYDDIRMDELLEYVLEEGIWAI